jgi:hypothetical protein
MAHDVFISHALKDKRIAEAICEKLEAAQVRCWIAERDISAGDDWIEAIRSAIGSSRAMVLVLSENANAAPHIEREIAHAFYTGCIIVPMRLTDTPPRRDFLFYLGNVRWFDAFSLPPEQHLEAFTANVNEIVRGPVASVDYTPPNQEIQPRRTFRSSETWISAGEAPLSGTLEIWKGVAIAASLFAVVGVWTLAPWQPKGEVPLVESDAPAKSSLPDALPDSMAAATGDEPSSKPATTSTVPGSWGVPNVTPVPLDQSGSQDPPSGSPVPLAPGATPPPETEAASDGRAKSERGDSARVVNHRDEHRRKTRTKRHVRRARPSQESLFGHIKSGLEEVWRQAVTGTKGPSDH